VRKIVLTKWADLSFCWTKCGVLGKRPRNARKPGKPEAGGRNAQKTLQGIETFPDKSKIVILQL